MSRDNSVDDVLKFAKTKHPNFIQLYFKGLTITRDNRL